MTFGLPRERLSIIVSTGPHGPSISRTIPPHELSVDVFASRPFLRVREGIHQEAPESSAFASQTRPGAPAAAAANEGVTRGR